MPANTVPIFPNVPNVGAVSFNTANTNRDGTGTISTLFSAGSNGSRIESAHVQSIGTTTAGVVRVFIHDGSSYFLLDEIMVTAATPSTLTPAWDADIECLSGLVLPTGYSVCISTHNAESFHAIAIGGNY